MPITNHLSCSFMIATLAFTLTACQTTPNIPVMQRANQTFETTGLGKSKLIAKQMALSYAQQTCKNASPIILTDDMVYNGLLGEKMDRVLGKVEKVAGVLMGNKVSTDLSQDDDYEYTITFKCQPKG